MVALVVIAVVFSTAAGAIGVVGATAPAASSPLSDEEMAVNHAVMVCPARWKTLQIA